MQNGEQTNLGATSWDFLGTRLETALLGNTVRSSAPNFFVLPSLYKTRGQGHGILPGSEEPEKRVK